MRQGLCGILEKIKFLFCRAEILIKKTDVQSIIAESDKSSQDALGPQGNSSSSQGFWVETTLNFTTEITLLIDCTKYP